MIFQLLGKSIGQAREAAIIPVAIEPRHHELGVAIQRRECPNVAASGIIFFAVRIVRFFALQNARISSAGKFRTRTFYTVLSGKASAAVEQRRQTPFMPRLKILK